MKILMPIGGALDHENPHIMREFVERSGGAQARIVILPQASALAETGSLYVHQCLALGAGQVISLEFRQRHAADTTENLRAIEEASGIFFTGGTQMRITQLIGGTRLADALYRAYLRGCVIAGTSAGASVLSKTMIAYGKSGPTPRERIVQCSPGLGFTDRFVFDQHFRQRDRWGRLIYVVCTHPGVLGIGIDEDTAAIIEDEQHIRVYGKGAVTILDGRTISESNVAEVDAGRPVAVGHLTAHILTAGCTYDCVNGNAHITVVPSLSDE
ncbi:cyanophycinase [Chloroflexus aurantiacus]